MNIHFFWEGNDFQFLNRITLISHIIVGHNPILYLMGKKPESIYWIDDIPEIEIRDAKEIFSDVKVDRIRAKSDLFSFYIVKQTGEYYSDVDAYAIKQWEDKEILLMGASNKFVGIGVFRLPKDHLILDYSIRHWRKRWKNVQVFTEACKKYGLWITEPVEDFCPVSPGPENISKNFDIYGKILDPVDLPESCKSYHIHCNKTSRSNITHEILEDEKIRGSLLESFCNDIISSI